MESSETSFIGPEGHLNPESSGTAPRETPSEYVQLQRRIFLSTLAATALAVVVSAIFFDLRTSISLLVGSICGVFYLRLLAKGIGSLGTTSKTVGRIQLLVPALLVIATSRLPYLELMPALLGFLLDKPSLIIQFLI